MLPSGVAAGHPATVAAGIEILEEGGTAADAAVAACLASCVAETVMTGLLGGGHAIYFDGEEAWNLDCFVDVPSGEGAPPVELHVPFGEELVHYAVGPGTCAVPGLPPASARSARRYGRLPWPRLVEPALRLARGGVAMPPAHAACLAMLAPVFTMQPTASASTRRRAACSRPARCSSSRGSRRRSSCSPARAPTASTGLDRRGLLGVEGVRVARDDLERYEARWEAPAELRVRGRAS